jgi:hypothetical protein
VNSRLLLAVAGGLLAVGIALFLILEGNRGSYLVLEGSIRETRVIAFDENSSGVLVDLRIHNPADYPYVVEGGTLELDLPDGATPAIAPVAASYIDTMLRFDPAAGARRSEVLLPRSRLNPKQMVDRMLAFRVDAPAERIRNRKGLRLIIEEADGKKTTLVESQKK